MSLSLYFRQFWTDPRLRFGENLDNVTKIVGGEEIADMIWKPDTFFVNERSSESKETFVRIHSNGSVLWSQRIGVTFVPTGELNHGGMFVDFPWDTQQYRLEMESFAYTMQHIRYSWKDDLPTAVQMSNSIYMTDLTLSGYRCRKIEASLQSGNYSRLEFDIFVSRRPGVFAASLFLPVALVTLLSLVALLLPRCQTTSRTLLTTLTTITMLGYKTWLHAAILPSVHYSTPATTYVDLHLAIVLLVLLHLAFDLMLAQRTAATSSSGMESIPLQDSSSLSDSMMMTSKPPNRRIVLMDKIYKILMPITFLLGQAVFWMSVHSLTPQRFLEDMDDIVPY